MLRSNHSRTARSGQTSLEFMAMLIFVMLVFTTFYTVFADRQMEVRQQQESLMAEQITNDVVFEIQMALVQGDGYARTFTVPEELLGNEYSMDVVNKTLILSWDDRNMYQDAIVDTVTGEFAPGENRIENVEGDIRVE